MKAQLRSQLNGEPVRPPLRPPRVVDDGLYRYQPVPPVHRDEDGYLLEDGMSQNYWHQTRTARWQYTLDRRLPAATVCSDLPLHYELGDTDKTVVPDLFVALRAPPREGRLSYKLWENPVPDLVIEMLSEGTWKKDVGPKYVTYEHLRVREYWLFDPADLQRSSTPLAGHRLRADGYRPIGADAAGRVRSEVLGLDLHVRDGELRFRDPATGEDLRTYGESEIRASAEKDRADTAERGRAAEKERADAERHRADMAERELARLRSRLEEP